MCWLHRFQLIRRADSVGRWDHGGGLQVSRAGLDPAGGGIAEGKILRRRESSYPLSSPSLCTSAMGIEDLLQGGRRRLPSSQHLRMPIVFKQPQ